MRRKSRSFDGKGAHLAADLSILPGILAFGYFLLSLCSQLCPLEHGCTAYVIAGALTFTCMTVP